MTRAVSSLLLGVLLCCTGCFGGGVVYSKRQTLQDFSIQSYSHVPYPSQAVRSSGPSALQSAASQPAVPNPPLSPDQNLANPTEADVRALWGEPDSSSKEKDGVVVWRYDNGPNLVGVVPMIFLPIPIIVPIGSNYSEIYFKDGRAFKASFSEMAAAGGYYGPANEATGKCQWNWMK
jgi:hypothetical protein